MLLIAIKQHLGEVTVYDRDGNDYKLILSFNRDDYLNDNLKI
jgi:hypothetical protein